MINGRRHPPAHPLWCSCSSSRCSCSGPSGFPRSAASSATGCGTSGQRSTGNTTSPKRSRRRTRSGHQTPPLSTSSRTRPPTARSDGHRVRARAHGGTPRTATSSRTSRRTGPRAATSAQHGEEPDSGHEFAYETSEPSDKRTEPLSLSTSLDADHELGAGERRAGCAAAAGPPSVARVRRGGGARRAAPWPSLEEELADDRGQATLLPEPSAPLLARAEAEIDAWSRRGLSAPDGPGRRLPGEPAHGP